MARQSREHTAKSVVKVWQAMCDLPQPITTNFRALGALVGEPDIDPGSLAHRIYTMMAVGVLSRELVRGGGPGEVSHRYTMLKSKDDGTKLLARHFARKGNLVKSAPDGDSVHTSARPVTRPAPVAPDVVAIHHNEKGEPVEAVVGEEAPSPFEALRALRKDEPAALIEAARQYANRQDFVIAQLEQIEKLGVKIDRVKVMQGISLERDDELEGIVKVLPFIDEMAARAGQVQGWKDDLVATRGELRLAREKIGHLEGDLRRQQEANERLATRMAQAAVSGQPVVLVGERSS